jgi:hypothetical protein
MKKIMMVIGIIAALSFLVSMIAVSSSMAVEATKTTPASQNPSGTTQPAQAAGLQGSPKGVAQNVIHSTFWDLEIDHYIVNGQSFPFINGPKQVPIIKVKVGQAINCECVYKIKTIPVGTITEADAKAWGSGNLSYTFTIGPYFSDTPSHKEYHIGQLNLPKFTYAEVQTWKVAIGASGRKEWTVTIPYSWTAAQEHVGKTIYLHFDIDSSNNIRETDEGNNGSSGGTGSLALIIVTPALPKDVSKQKLEKNK